LNCCHLEQGLYLVSNAPSLGVRWLWHVTQQHRRRHYVLACSREAADRLLWLCVSDDLSMYLSSASVNTSTWQVWQVLRKDLLKQDEALSVFVELHLELTQLR